MIELKADFNHRDSAGRLILSDLAVHRATAFEVVAADHPRVLFVHDTDVVIGQLVRDDELGWVGLADWATLDERPLSGGTKRRGPSVA